MFDAFFINHRIKKSYLLPVYYPEFCRPIDYFLQRNMFALKIYG